MSTSEFYKWFDKFSPKLQIRKEAFYKIFKYLDSMPDPIIIVETGCLRIKDNYLDGQSTLLFDKYTQFRAKNSKVSEIQTLWVFALSSSDTPRCSCISNSSSWIFELSLSVLNLTVREFKKTSNCAQDNRLF